MVEIGCLCCGAELSRRHTQPQTVMDSMCERCIREVDRMQRALRTVKQENRPTVVH